MNARIVENSLAPKNPRRFAVEIEQEIYFPSGLFSAPKVYSTWVREHSKLTLAQAEALIANNGSKWKSI